MVGAVHEVPAREGHMRSSALHPHRAPVVRAAVLAALATVLLTLVGAPPASAHNALRGSDPADGSTVPAAPDRVTLTFDQVAIELGSEVVVTAPDGTVVSEGPVQVAETDVVQILADERPAGEYQVAWRVTSADGHPISGTFVFTAAEGTGEPEPTIEQTATPTPEPTTPAATAPTTAPSAAQTAAPAERDVAAAGTPAWLWVVGAAAVVAAVAVAVVAARRRTSPGRGDATPGDEDR
ncbi:hypothetical protein GCM10023113_02460 [Cellulomonas oligotrophica]|uniref:CopC domain-containing protein n=2 Tax=Cellulomonas oligotrophica TaxID=931536 RepID=A0ABQ4DAE3_9CELL|nr:hypothetical protein Col01nite_18560 [Cellulomonas oligotrophica]